MLIWVLFAGMTAVAALAVLVPLMRRRAGGGTEEVGGAEGEVAVYRDQLAEVERDLEGGLVGPAEAEAAHAEIARRILRASRATGAASAAAPGRRVGIVGFVAVVLVPLVALGVYLRVGHPDQPDAPLAERRAAAATTPSLEDLVRRVEERLAAQPNDVRGWDVLAPVYMRVGRFEESANAWRKAIALGGPNERRLNGLGEALVEVASGTVTPEARDAFEKSLREEPRGVLPRMYLALALSQEGRTEESAAAWRSLITSAAGDEPWLPAAREELAKVDPKAAAAMPPPAPPAAAQPGPSSADVQAAAQMSPEDRAKMIETMVGRLKDRLLANGGTIDEWERLIRAEKTLGRLDDARDALARAEAAFAADAAAKARLEALTPGLRP